MPITQEPAEFYSIVVVGAMNPRIHHPIWYRTIDAIGDQELSSATNPDNAENPVVTPVYSQFEIPSANVTVSCQPDRWEIKTTSPGCVNQLIAIASKVFDRLRETPVTAYGINSVVNRRTAAPVVRVALAQLISKLGLGLPAENALGPRVGAKFVKGDHTVTVDIRASAISDEMVFIAYNSEYKPPAVSQENRIGYFDLGALLTARVPVHQLEVEEMVLGVVNGLAPQPSK